MKKEIQLKDPNTCEHFKEVGCIKDICTCYTLVKDDFKIQAIDGKTYTRDELLRTNFIMVGGEWHGNTIPTEKYKNLTDFLNGKPSN